MTPLSPENISGVVIVEELVMDELKWGVWLILANRWVRGAVDNNFNNEHLLPGRVVYNNAAMHKNAAKL